MVIGKPYLVWTVCCSLSGKPERGAWTKSSVVHGVAFSGGTAMPLRLNMLLRFCRWTWRMRYGFWVLSSAAYSSLLTENHIGRSILSFHGASCAARFVPPLGEDIGATAANWSGLAAMVVQVFP